jgi:hypothetical protein
LLYSADSKFGIYQIRDDIDNVRDFRFTPMREMDALGVSVERSNYTLAYVGDLPNNEIQTNLDRIFSVFQHDSPECPQNFTGRSASVSDVIVLQLSGEVSAHYVDSADFKELPIFTGNENHSEQPLEQGIPLVEKNSEIVVSEKRKPSLMQRFEANKQKAAQQNKKDTVNLTDREV